ncbi:hypothetical protein AB0B66_33745 [Catellatospora sp. NPDC049111]|uniref:hypothetical protein n=1 Tax=Catellatospora sp. NPDC049111 TaxID=3155271 RepID=UPI00341118E3
MKEDNNTVTLRFGRTTIIIALRQSGRSHAGTRLPDRSQCIVKTAAATVKIMSGSRHA